MYMGRTRLIPVRPACQVAKQVKPASAVLAACALTALAACGSPGAGQPPAQSPTPASGDHGPATSSATPAAQFPVTISAPGGPVAIKAQPARIVSLSPTATEDLFAVG